MKRVMFSLIALIGLSTTVFAYNYDTNLPLPGNSIADTKLQENTLFTAYMFAHRIAPANCQNFAIIDTNVSQEKVDNKWQEVWTIKACTKTAFVPIDFIEKETGSVYAIDPMGVRVTDNQ